MCVACSLIFPFIKLEKCLSLQIELFLCGFAVILRVVHYILILSIYYRVLPCIITNIHQGSPKELFKRWSTIKKCNAKSMFYTFEDRKQWRPIDLCTNQSIYIGISLNLMIEHFNLMMEQLHHKIPYGDPWFTVCCMQKHDSRTEERQHAYLRQNNSSNYSFARWSCVFMTLFL